MTEQGRLFDAPPSVDNPYRIRRHPIPRVASALPNDEPRRPYTVPLIPGTTQAELRFLEWIETEDGRTVEQEFIQRARMLKARGKTRYGARALVEVLRYDAAVRLEGDDSFRINNDHAARLARRVMEQCPDLAGFFEVRELGGRR